VAPLVGAAKCDILERRLPSARKALEDALAREPQHSEANALMGYVLLAEGRPGEAAPHLTLALRDPQCAGRATVERLLARANGHPPGAARPADDN
jgi:cytochrome c-type biogenesis protein CcmH/NrfG